MVASSTARVVPECAAKGSTSDKVMTTRRALFMTCSLWVGFNPLRWPIVDEHCDVKSTRTQLSTRSRPNPVLHTCGRWACRCPRPSARFTGREGQLAPAPNIGRFTGQEGWLAPRPEHWQVHTSGRLGLPRSSAASLPASQFICYSVYPVSEIIRRGSQVVQPQSIRRATLFDR